MGWAALDCVGKTSLALDLIAQRQRALGSNLANVDTPGYVRRDIDFSQYIGGATASLETKLAQLNNILDKKNLKPEEKKKLEQLKTLYLQQKNILIENKTEQAKKEVIAHNKIDVNKYLLEEQEKRKKAMEEAQKKMDEQMKKEKGEAKAEKSASEMQPQVTTKIFRNQEMYKGTEPFKDPLFKPEKASLCPFDKSGWILPEDALDDDVDGWETFKWCRVEEL